jgi:hypothetical protein
MLASDSRANKSEKELALRLALAGGWFASSPIRSELLVRAACSLRDSRDEESSKGEELVAEAIGLLKFYALATSTSNNRIAFHPLVQSFGKWKGGEGAGAGMIQGLLEVWEVEQDPDHFESALEHGGGRSNCHDTCGNARWAEIGHKHWDPLGRILYRKGVPTYFS